MARLDAPRDAVTLLVQHLNSAQLDVPVTGRRVGSPRGRAVQVRSTGGTHPHPGRWRHQLTLTVWGAGEDDETATDALAAVVMAHVVHLDVTGSIAGQPCGNLLIINHIYPDPDPETRRYRASFTITVDIRSTEL